MTATEADKGRDARSRNRTSSPIVIQNARVGLRGPVTDIRIANGLVVGLGDDAAREPGDDVINGTGHSVLPGLWDAHVHSLKWAEARRRIDVSGTASAQHAVSVVDNIQRSRSALSVDSGLLVGYGFRDGLWRDRPDKSMLDAALPGVAVALVSNDMHTVWMSSSALRLIGWSEHPTGLLRESDAFRAQQLFPTASVEDADRRLREELRTAAARGVTGLMDFEHADNARDWSRRHHRDPLNVRVTCTIYPEYLDDAIERGWRTGATMPSSEGMIEVGPLKIFVDGSLNTRTALCEAPYPEDQDGVDSHGMQLTESAELQRLVQYAHTHGLQTAAHAIGDRANRLALDAFERVGCGGRIEHAQLLNREDLPRFAKLGVTAGVQPVHALGDREVAERLWAGRTDRAFCYGPMVSAGARIEIGSDAPVAPLDPWAGIAAAVARSDGDQSPWHPENAISIDNALAAASRGRRSVTAGDPADLVIVEEDPSRLTPPDLRVIPVLGCMVAGRWTFRSTDEMA